MAQAPQDPSSNGPDAAKPATDAANPVPAALEPATLANTITTIARWALALFLFVAGVGHFVRADAFLAQVPTWVPWPEATVAISGVIEIALAAALMLTAGSRWLPTVGWITAAFFVAVFPGNIAQFIEGRDAFGLDTDAARAIRLLFQPLLIAWALWCTGAWRAWRSRNRVH